MERGGTGRRKRRSRRRLLYLVLVLMFMAMAKIARGGGGGGGEGGEFLRLWGDGGGEGDHEQELEWQEEDDDDDGDHIMMWGTSCRPPAWRNVVNVESFGAAGDGCADDTEAFLNAWDKACSLDNAVFLVPGGRRYKVSVSRFTGPCKDNLIIQIQGTVVAPEEPSEWDPKNPRLWLLFSGLAGARIQGGGIIDGSGSKWWANSCKINKTNPCKGAPTAVTIDSCSGVRVKGLRIQNSQQMHLTVSRSRNVRVTGVHIQSPEDSPNTDGIHIAESTAVTVQNCRIGTGDDCISISNASFYIKMKHIYCGPGHGISIGSLGKDRSVAAVDGVVLDTATISNAQNGVRIKTWQGGSGYVRNVRFSNVHINDVDHPIIIDQFYCDSKTPCHNQSSSVKVSNVVYKNISGTSRRTEAIKFACSDAAPCSNIVLADIDLHLTEQGEAAQTVCNCAMGFDYGHVSPAADCLRASICDGAGAGVGEQPPGHDDDDEMDDDYEPPILHTEL